MAISMADIQHLRKMTGAGMMDCKNALNEAEGDFDKAVEIIRKKGQAFAAKREDREAAEGCVLAATQGDFAAIVAVNCETDFVAMNADFVGMTKSILDAALESKPADIDTLKAVEHTEWVLQVKKWSSAFTNKLQLLQLLLMFTRVTN